MSELEHDRTNLDSKFKSEIKHSGKKDDISVSSSQVSRKRDKKAANKLKADQ